MYTNLSKYTKKKNDQKCLIQQWLLLNNYFFQKVKRSSSWPACHVSFGLNSQDKVCQTCYHWSHWLCCYTEWKDWRPLTKLLMMHNIKIIFRLETTFFLKCCVWHLLKLSEAEYWNDKLYLVLRLPQIFTKNMALNH